MIVDELNVIRSIEHDILLSVLIESVDRYLFES
jgi:hypothetical protein